MKKALFLFLLLFPQAAFGGVPQELPRKIIAFYDKTLHPDPSFTAIHRQAEMPLNHLGLQVTYHAVQDPMPSEEEMQEAQGILTWFEKNDAVANPGPYCAWLDGQMNRGKKLVILEQPGFLYGLDEKIAPECLTVLRRLGAEYQGMFSGNPFFFEITQKDPRMVEYERKLSLTEGLVYSLFRPTDAQTKTYLKIKRKDLENSESALVFTSPRGGFVSLSYANFALPELNKQQWRLNPFLFFAEAFQIQGWPRPDVTTMNGERILYNHVDADGIFNISQIDRKSFSSEIILKEILEKYSGLPITISLIAGYLDLPDFQGKKVTALYQSIFSLPNVEPSSHGYAYPLVWEEGKEKELLNIPGYSFDPRTEIVGSSEKINHLFETLGIPKKVRLFQWTGDSRPSDAQVAIAEENGLLNLNGGQSRFDRASDSYSFVFPIGISRKFRQIYAADPGEAAGFQSILETYQNTENPRRVKPIDIYYRFSSGDRTASLEGLKQIYDQILETKNFPMFAGDYVQIADDFFHTSIQEIPGGWQISNRGFLKTLRFDQENRNVDLKKSRNVLGFTHYQGNLYVHLGEGGGPFQIFLSSAPPQQPYLKNATFRVQNWKEQDGTLTFTKQGWGKSEMTLGGLIPGKNYLIQSNAESWHVPSNPQGELSVRFRQAENGRPADEVRVRLEHL
ncbi:MAG TPA: hypothetical protein DF383_01985 [Deltaproteobacteria bacterium]|nr:hypothetical protein [Deltaproteobacteria bacterium]